MTVTMPQKPFDRPELSTPWQRFTHNIFVRISAALALTAGSVALAGVALTR